MRGEVSLWIDAEPQAVWEIVSDVTRIGELSPETFEAMWTHGATGPAVGARFKGHVKRNGVGPTYWTTCTVTTCVAGEDFGFGVYAGTTKSTTGATSWPRRTAGRGSPSPSSSRPLASARSTGGCWVGTAAGPTSVG